jgi:hypothetical protein
VASIPHKNSGEESKIEAQDLNQPKNHDFSEGDTFTSGLGKGTSIIAFKICDSATYQLTLFYQFWLSNLSYLKNFDFLSVRS